MIIFSLYSDDQKDDIIHYSEQTRNLLSWLDINSIRFTSKTFIENGVQLFVLLIDSNVKTQINYLVKEFDLPKKNFKFILGGHIPK